MFNGLLKHKCYPLNVFKYYNQSYHKDCVFTLKDGFICTHYKERKMCRRQICQNNNSLGISTSDNETLIDLKKKYARKMWVLHLLNNTNLNPTIPWNLGFKK